MARGRPSKDRVPLSTDPKLYEQFGLKLDTAEAELGAAKDAYAADWQVFTEAGGNERVMRRYLKLRRRLNSDKDEVRGAARDELRAENVAKEGLRINDQEDMFDQEADLARRAEAQAAASTVPTPAPADGDMAGTMTWPDGSVTKHSKAKSGNGAGKPKVTKGDAKGAIAAAKEHLGTGDDLPPAA